MGFEKVILEDGQGTNVPPGATVTVHCTGYGKNGDLKEKFWSTKDPGQEPFTFKIGMGNVSTHSPRHSLSASYLCPLLQLLIVFFVLGNQGLG